MSHSDTEGKVASVQEKPQEASPSSARDTEPKPRTADAQEEWRKLLVLYERDLENLTAPRDRANLLYTMGEIIEFQLNNPEEALALYQQAFETDQSYIPPIKSAIRLFSNIDNWDVVLMLHTMLEQATTSVEENVSSKIERSRILLFSLGRTEEAEAVLTEALGMDPGNEVLQKLLEQVYLRKGSAEELFSFYTTMSQKGLGGLKVDAMLHLALMKEHVDTDQQEAIRLFEAVLTVEPDNSVSLAALNRLYTRFGLWEELVRILEQELAGAPSEEVPNLCYRLGHIYRDELKQTDQGLRYFRQGLEKDPEHLVLLNDVVETLEFKENWAELKEAYDHMLKVVDSNEQLLDIHLKLASLCEDKLDAHDEALEHYQAIIDITPNYVPVVARIARLYSHTAQWDRLVNLTLRECENLHDPKTKASRYYRVAEIYEHNLNDPEQAITYYRRVLDEVPDSTPAIKSLAALLCRLNRWQELVEVNEREIAITENRDHLMYLLHLNASIYHDYLKRPEMAIECLSRAMKIDGEHLSTVQLLGKLYARENKWEELVKVNTLESELVSDPRRMITLLYRNGEICEKELNDTERAAKYYKQVLSLSPDYLPALRALGNLYLNEGRWEDLLKMYRQELRITREPMQREQILYRIGSICEEELKDLERAQEHYEAILEDSPDSLAAMHALERVHRMRNNAEKLVEIYTRQATSVQNMEMKLYYLFKVAEVYESLELHALAEQTYRSMLELSPGYHPACKALRRIYATLDRVPESLEIISQELEYSTSDAEKILLLAAMAELFQKQKGRDADTIKAFEDILSLDPNHLHSLRELERLYEKTGHKTKLRPVYEQRIELSHNPETRRTYYWLLINLKELYFPQEDLLNDFIEVQKLAPSDHRSLDWLISRSISEGNWSRVLELYGNAVDHAVSEDEKVFFTMQQGQVFEMQLGDYGAAEEKYHRVLAIREGYIPAISALKRCYAHSENWSGMRDILEKEVASISGERQLIATFYQLGFLYETKLNDDAQAMVYYSKTLELRRSHPEAYFRLKGLLEAAGRWQELFDICSHRLPALSNPVEIGRAHFDLGILAEEQTGDKAGAMTHYRKALENSPDNKEIMWRLAQLYLDGQRWNDAEEMLSRLAAVVADRDELIALYRSQAMLYEDQIKDIPRAVAALEELVNVGEEDPAVREKLSALYATTDRVEEAIACLRILLKNTNLIDEKKIEYNLAVSNLYAERLNRNDRAIKYLRQALELDPSSEAILSTLTDLFGRTGEWSQLIDLYREQLERLPEDAHELRAKVLQGFAKVYQNNMNDLSAAEEMLRQALVETPQSEDIQVQLANLLAGQGHRLDDAAEALRKVIALNPFNPEPYHRLYDIFIQQQKRDAAFCVTNVLNYLSESSEEQTALYRRFSDSRAAETAPIKTEDFDRYVRHPHEQTLLSDIVQLISVAYYKTNPPNLAAYGLDNAERIGPSHSLYQLTESMSYQMGVERCTMYVDREHSGVFAVEPTRPPTIILDGSIAYGPESSKRFFLGVAISRMRRSHMLHISHTAAQVQAMVEAAVHQYVPDMPISSDNMREVSAMGKQLVKSLSRPNKKQLEPLARSYAEQQGKMDADIWLRAKYNTDYRVGLMMCTDVAAAVQAWHLVNGIDYHRPVNAQEALSFHSELGQIKNMLCYAVSEEYFTIRTMARLAIT